MVKKAVVSVLAFICLLCCMCFSACGAETINYNDAAQWAYFKQGCDHQADLFLVCPTVDIGRGGNMNMSTDDDKAKESFIGALNMERGIYEDTLTMYAPYYRQATYRAWAAADIDTEKYLQIAYQDVRSAFLVFLENTPQDRPFILAGFSQGSDMVLRLMKEFLCDTMLQDRLIAAYCIGWRITDDDVDNYPWIKPAQAANDVGVVISFNSEAESVTDSILVPRGTETYSINPLNWRTDGTYASASENRGAYFTDYSGKIVKEIVEFTGAYIDEIRGTLKTTDIVPADYSNDLFPDGVYHLYDYQFFYRNLQENVARRTETYFQLKTVAEVA